MQPRTITIPPITLPYFHNWKTTVSGLTGLIVLALTHQTAWRPLVPTKYVPVADFIVLVCGAIFSVATKDAGQHTDQPAP